jgi:hypothetical protein
MTRITDEMRTDFREHGFVVVPDVLTGDQLAFGHKVVAAMHAKKPTPRIMSERFSSGRRPPSRCSPVAGSPTRPN